MFRLVCRVPEGERVVPHEGLALPDQEGSVRRSRLLAVLGQQPLGDLTAVSPGAQLPVEPLLCHVLVHAVGNLVRKGQSLDSSHSGDVCIFK